MEIPNITEKGGHHWQKGSQSEFVAWVCEGDVTVTDKRPFAKTYYTEFNDNPKLKIIYVDLILLKQFEQLAISAPEQAKTKVDSSTDKQLTWDMMQIYCVCVHCIVLELIHRNISQVFQHHMILMSYDFSANAVLLIPLDIIKSSPLALMVIKMNANPISKLSVGSRHFEVLQSFSPKHLHSETCQHLVKTFEL